MSMITEDVLARFWARVDKAEPSQCWMWTKKSGQAMQGYGAIYLWGYMRVAHRVSWEIHYGTIPDGLCVLHHCDNPPCVNPEHLFLGTNYDNILDKMLKDRSGKKLKRKQIREIRASTLRQSELASIYGVCENHISGICRRVFWKHVA